MRRQSASLLPDGFSANSRHLSPPLRAPSTLTRWHHCINAFAGTNLPLPAGPHQKTCARLVAAKSLPVNTKAAKRRRTLRGPSMKIGIGTCIAIGLGTAIVASIYSTQVQSQSNVAEPVSRFDGKTRRERFTHKGGIDRELSSDTSPAVTGRAAAIPKTAPTEAATGFDNLTNGASEQGPAFESINAGNVMARHSFNDNRFVFEEVEQIADGLGPTYNAQSCRECHQNVVTGG